MAFLVTFMLDTVFSKYADCKENVRTGVVGNKVEWYTHSRAEGRAFYK
jgi:hypothetical protein